MGIGTSLFLIAVGAILKYAVSDAVDGIDLSTVGLILMIVGVVGLVITLVYPSLWARQRGPRDRTIVRDRDVY
jgi:Domain of unknown function (DUF6458)